MRFTSADTEAAVTSSPLSVKTSSVCTVVGSACLWAWGFMAALSPNLFPETWFETGSNVEYSFYASQAVLVVLALIAVTCFRRKVPTLPRGMVAAAALLLMLASYTVSLVTRLADPPDVAFIACGIAYGVGDMLLTIAWGTRYSLGSRSMHALVLTSFLLAYALYLLGLMLPLPLARIATIAMPGISAVLWYADATRRQNATQGVWPVTGEDAFPGEIAAGDPEPGILPWKALSVFAITSFIGSLASSCIMGTTYEGSSVMFPCGVVVCAFIAAAALLFEKGTQDSLSIERLYHLVLPVGVLGMLMAMMASPEGLAPAGALVMGASFFLQVIIVLKVTETVQRTTMSPFIAFSAGSGLIGGVVFMGDVLGRLLGTATGDDSRWLGYICAGGVLALVVLLTLLVNDQAKTRFLEEETPAADEKTRDLAGSAQACLENTSPDEASVSPHAHGAVDSIAAHAADFSAAHGLTPREQDVLELLLRGRSLPAVAKRLFITAGTAKTHALRIYRKVGVGGRQELVDAFESWVLDSAHI